MPWVLSPVQVRCKNRRFLQMSVGAITDREKNEWGRIAKRTQRSSNRSKECGGEGVERREEGGWL